MKRDATKVPSRIHIANVGETAKAARARGCRVYDGIPDDAHVVHIDDFYPLRYAWSIYWSNGIADGVRSDETDEIKAKEGERALRLRPKLRWAIPEPHITVADLDGELCFEWWRGEEKYTLYTQPKNIIHVAKDGTVADGTQAALMQWLRDAVRRDDPPKFDEVLTRALAEPTLVDALSLVATFENERAVAQALRGQRDPHTGALWDTCFRYCFQRVLAQYGGVNAGALDRGDRLWRALDDLTCKVSPIALGMKSLHPSMLFEPAKKARRILDAERRREPPVGYGSIRFGREYPDFGAIAEATIAEYGGALTVGALAHELGMAYEAGQQHPEVREQKTTACPDCGGTGHVEEDGAGALGYLVKRDCPRGCPSQHVIVGTEPRRGPTACVECGRPGPVATETYQPSSICSTCSARPERPVLFIVMRYEPEVVVHSVFSTRVQAEAYCEAQKKTNSPFWWSVHERKLDAMLISKERP